MKETEKKYQNLYKKFVKSACNFCKSCYNHSCCDMIAMKFEVTTHEVENSAERMSS